MERLTKKDAYWIDEEFWISAEEPDDEEIDKVYMKLKEYEDLEEQGRLIKLPCKVGDTVYFFKALNDGKNTIVIEEFEIRMYSFTTSGLFMIDRFRHSLGVELIGKTVFLTKEEAEKALAEMWE